MNKKLNILIFEHTNSHSVLFDSQIKFLDKYDHSIHLWINKNSDTTDLKITSLTFIDPTHSKLKIFLSLFRYLRTKKIDLIIFNTAHGLFIRDLSLLLLFSKVRAYGILHQADKVLYSVTQKIISLKIKHYYVLNDFVLEWLKKNFLSEKIKFSSFYPIYFPERFYTKKEQHKSIILCIPGAIEPERKDYIFLINYLKRFNTEVNSGIKFKLLGDISSDKGKQLHKLIIDNKVENWFITFDSFLSNEIFFKELNNSDFIFPLIHPSGKHFNAFYKTGISFAFSLAFAFKKPLLIHNQFRLNEEYKNVSVFYDEKNLHSVFKCIVSDDLLVSRLEDGYRTLPKLEFNFQAESYNEFLLSN
jgi:hypothetical protein